jgi:ABC-type sugar transport system ATPase subunit
MTDTTVPVRDAEEAVSEGAVLLRVESVAKAFGPTKALRDGSLELRAGEVLALVGENGSGKSTLVKILSGVHQPDAGRIWVGGEQVSGLANPRDARTHGIATVFQEVLVAEARSVLDNVWLGVENIRGRVSRAEKTRLAREVLTTLLGTCPDLSTPVEELSLSDRQACGIARALLGNPKVLILDEATSALDVEMRDRLFAHVHRLTAEGAGVIFITHRMDEVAELGDRVSVMRSGVTVGLLDRSEASLPVLVKLMTGNEETEREARVQRSKEGIGAVYATATGIVLRPGCAPFDVEVRAGEILGLAGLEGQGAEIFLDALRGVKIVSGEVVRHSDGGDVRITSTRAAARQGIAFVPRERGHAVFSWMSIRENFGMPTLRDDTRGGILSRRHTLSRLQEYIGRLNIVLGDPENHITTLSGGNQQKVVVARWLAAHPRVLLLNDPTRGIDINAKNDLYRLLSELAAAGLAVVMLSTEVDEQIELMDRVLVFREGTVTREFDGADVTREALVGAYFGEAPEEVPTLEGTVPDTKEVGS